MVDISNDLQGTKNHLIQQQQHLYLENTAYIIVRTCEQIYTYNNIHG